MRIKWKDSVDKIKSDFPPKTINVNQLVSDVASGDGAMYLGKYTPLVVAILYKRLDMVKTLIEDYNADPNFKSGRGEDHTALDCAKKWAKGKPEIIEYLKGVKGALWFVGIKQFCEQIKQNDYVDKIKSDFPPGTINVNQLVEGVAFGWGAMIIGKYTPLVVAILYKRLDMVKTLIEEYDADPNFMSGRGKDWTAYDCAKKWGNPEIIEYLDAKKILLKI